MPTSASSDAAEQPLLRLEGVSVDYGRVRAVDGVDLTVGGPEGGVVGLLGPSGCGKSTLLRALAGIEPLASGTVSFGGRDLARTPAHRRGFGLVFQDGQLFPHRTVAGNIAYGLRGRGRGAGPARADGSGERGWRARRRAREARVAELLDLVGLAGFGGRRTGELSGGQAQRVALARALAPHPRMLLLDEPLAALDRELRDRLAADIARILRTTGTPALIVTHDHGEAAAVAERIAVMRDGRITQQCAPRRLWRYPRDTATARFLGYPVVIDAQAAGGVADSALGRVAVRHPDGPVRLGLRAESIVAAPAAPSVTPPGTLGAPGTSGPDGVSGPAGTGGVEGAEPSGAVRATVESVTALPSRTLVTVVPEAGVGPRDRGVTDSVVATFDADGGAALGPGTGCGVPCVEGPAQRPAAGDAVVLRLVPGRIAVITGESVREVAAGAVVDGDRVLVARRAGPPELAGLWEFPGGKVEPGESGPEGLRRELAEELGLAVRVHGRLAGEVPLGGTTVLRTYHATAAGGTASALEHSEVRWVRAAELERLDLVDADRTWIPALRRILAAGGA